MAVKPTGILLMAFGGPDSPEAIEPFMKNLMGGRTPPPPLVEKIKARYRLLGGSSPLPKITAAQAEGLEKTLRDRGGLFFAEVGMLHWRPFIDEGLEKLVGAGCEIVVGLSLAPFFSKVSTGAYLAELTRSAARFSPQPQILAAGPFYNQPKYIKAVADQVQAAQNLIPAERVPEAAVIFSAHSLPTSAELKDDPYRRQFEFLSGRVAAELGLENWHLAYQSKGGGQGEWLGPPVEDLMDELKAQGISDILVAPVGFVSDHIETLYDVDIAQKEHATRLGLNFYRSASLNVLPLFLEALADLVEKTLAEQ